MLRAKRAARGVLLNTRLMRSEIGAYTMNPDQITRQQAAAMRATLNTAAHDGRRRPATASKPARYTLTLSAGDLALIDYLLSQLEKEIPNNGL
jgi:hypothetical protein